jgi:hypothetical protein
VNGNKTKYTEYIRAAETAGWTVRLTGRDHLRFQGPDGQVIFASQTPSDHRAHLNLRAMLRRAGLAL